MRPSIEPGQPLVVRPTRADDLAIGDVVAWVGADGRVIAHRLVRRAGRRLITRGDASRWEDPPTEPSHVVGLVMRGGTAGRAIARWPRLAPLIGACGTVRRPSDVPRALGRAAGALRVRAGRLGR